jgi:putative flippase GtrA
MDRMTRHGASRTGVRALQPARARSDRSLTGRLGDGGRFLVVGFVGIGVNQALLYLFAGPLGISYLLGAVLASQGSTAFNFAGNEIWVFGRRQSGSRLRRFLAFDLLNSASLLIRIPLLYVLVSIVGVHYLTANLAVIVLLTVVRFAICDMLIWKRQPRRAARRAAVAHS